MDATGAPPGRPRIDERVLGAGTGPRFVVLLLLMLTAGGAMILEVVRVLADGDESGCSLAAGVDPADGSYWKTSLSISGQVTASRFCLSLWAPAPPWWQVAAWPLLLLVVAALLFAALPHWKARRSRVIPLAAVDPDGELLALLTELCTATGVAPTPRVVVDPAASSVSAVVFGRTRRPVVCLHGGLLAVRRRDPERFRAVLLHELAHIANRDVTLTYLTVALWRVFLALVLLPYVLCLGYVIYGVVADGRVPQLDRAVALAVVMVVLLYLARSDALRSREIYADLAAVRWGADPHGWSVSAAPSGSAVRRLLDAFLDLWRTHPRWGLRQGALVDPAPLFRTSVLPLFLIGTVPVLAVQQVLRQIAPYRVNFTNNLMTLLVIVPGALVTGVIVVALWRAVVYAVLTGTRVPSGAWAGGWLGAGMSAGLVLSGWGAGWAWQPQRPLVLLVPVAAGAAFGWWTTQCAHLWTRTSRGRTPRPALTLCLAAGCVAMTSWLTWWMLAGATALNRDFPGAQAVAQSVLQWLPSKAPTGDPTRIPGIALVLPQLSNVADTPMGSLAVIVLWVVPLLAWASGTAGRTPRWMPDREPRPEGPVAPLRKVMLPGLLGGALAGLAVVGVQAWIHTGQPVPDARGGLYALRYAGLLLPAICLPAGLAAAVASAADRRFRLPGALIAAGTATVLGAAAMTLLVSVDGCVTPLNVLSDSCAWRPAWWRPLFPFTFVLNNALVLSGLTAVAVALTAAAVTAVRRRRPSASRTTRRPDTRAGEPRARGPRARRLAVILLCVVAVAGTATDGGFRRYQLGFMVNELTSQRSLVQFWGLPDPPRSELTRVRQIRAWYRLSGDDLIDMAVSYDSRLTAAVREAQAAKDSWEALDRRLRPACTQWGSAAWFETVWFRLPADPRLRADWHAVTIKADNGSRGCAQALTARDQAGLRSALLDLYAARRCAESVNAGIDGILRAGGFRGTTRPPAQGTAAVCDRPAS
ncbi:M48 family metallopeptidase [Kitasatospora sp. NPDC058063]|uniref:M48 family metallopeptidase n=1 Tax=unclassified Kitasatospora TaxID=2633591 RepID=UPI0036D7DE3F